MVDVAGDVLVGAGRGEGGGNADNDAALDVGELVGEVDLVSGAVLDQEVPVGECIALRHEQSARAVELRDAGGGTERSCASAEGAGEGRKGAERHGCGDAGSLAMAYRSQWLDAKYMGR